MNKDTEPFVLQYKTFNGYMQIQTCSSDHLNNGWPDT